MKETLPYAVWRIRFYLYKSKQRLRKRTLIIGDFQLAMAESFSF